MEIGDRVRLKRKPFFTGRKNGEQLVLPGIREDRSFFIGWSFKPEGSLSHKPYSENILEKTEKSEIPDLESA